MKKIISLCLVFVLMFGVLSVAASAVSVKEPGHTEMLDALFLDGEYRYGFDYVYYSPKKSEDDNTKYPLMIWLHGKSSGFEKRAQLMYYEFSNWASDEFQARFQPTGGCYLLLPRASDGNFEGSSDCTLLKNTIDYFISLNADNIDTDKIYIGGYSSGATHVWDMVSQYSGFFAAAISGAAPMLPTTEEMNKLSRTSIWIFSSDKDFYVAGRSDDAYERFNYLKTISTRPESVRITTVSDARFADGSKRTNLETGKLTSDCEHFIWEAVTYDMHMNDWKTPYIYTTTYDAKGNAISFDNPETGVISWLTQQSRVMEETPVPEKPHEKTFFEKITDFFKTIINFIKGLFGK